MFIGLNETGGLPNEFTNGEFQAGATQRSLKDDGFGRCSDWSNKPRHLDLALWRECRRGPTRDNPGRSTGSRSQSLYISALPAQSPGHPARSTAPTRRPRPIEGEIIRSEVGPPIRHRRARNRAG